MKTVCMGNTNRSIGVALIANILSMSISLGVSFLLTPFLIKSLGKETYSFFPLANNFVSYFTILTVSLNSMASRFFTIAKTSGNIKDANSIFSSLFISNTILAVILLVPMACIIINVDTILNVPVKLKSDVEILFLCVFSGMIISLVTSVFGIATFACERMDLYALQNIIMNILKGSLYIILFCFFAPSIRYMGLVIVIITIYTGIIQYIFAVKLLPDIHISLLLFEKSKVFELFRSGIWNSINNLGTSLLMGTTLLLGNTLIGTAASGDLSIVQTLPNFMTTIITTIQNVLWPHITVVYAKGNAENTKKAVIQGQKILGMITTVPCVLIIVFGKAFLSLWLDLEDASYLQILSIITILPLLLHSTMWPVYALNITNNRVEKPAILLFLTGIINMILTIILVHITSLGTIAISLSCTVCCLAYYFIFIPRYAAQQMQFPWHTFYPHIVKSVIFSIIFITVCIPFKSVIKIDTWKMFFIIGGIAEIIGLFLYFMIVLERNDRIWMFSQIKKIINAEEE